MSEDSRVPSHSSPGARWQPPSPDELHAQLRQYEILEILGVGGMGAVYKGFQTSLERYVAVKILPPSVSDEDLHYTERFKQEAKTMARLSHPGIIGVHDCGETPEGLLYIVMEYVEGTDVHQMILAQGHLPAEQALAISMHVCDALSYAHEHGVIHRDIKPANIMVDRQGRVKVADFGLAKMATVQSGLSTANITLGTAEYVAPEALTIGVEVDQRVDIYSMGVTLYEMLCGKVPRGRFAAASAVVPGLDHRFDDVINRAMQDNRDARYSSAAEFRQALMMIHSVPPPNLSQSAPASARRPAPMSRSRSTLIAEPAKSGFPYALVAGLVTVLAVGLFLWKPWASPKDDHPSTESSTTPPQETKSKEAEATHPTPAPAGKVADDPAKPTPLTSPAPTPVPVVTAVPSPTPEAPPAPAAPPPKSELDQRLDTLEEKFQAAAEAKVETTFKDSVATLNRGYYAAVERALTDATQSGKLDDAVALRDELKRPDKTAILPNDANISTDPNPPPPSLKDLRTTYWTTMKRLEADRLKAYAPLFDRYDEALAQIQTELTKAGKIDDAVRLKELRGALVDRRTSPSAYASSSSTAAGTNPVVPSEEINLFENGSFEKGTEGWTLNSNKNVGKMAIDPKENYHGRPALRIDNAQPDDTHVLQKVAVKPHTRYKIAGWMKTGELGVLSEKTKPESCLAVDGGYIKTQPMHSSQDWTRVAKEFETKDETEIKVGARLGFYSDLTSGTAWFAGLSFNEVAPQVAGAPTTKSAVVDALLAANKPWTGDIALPPREYHPKNQIVVGRFDRTDAKNSVVGNVTSSPGTTLGSANILVQKGMFKADGTLFKETTIVMEYGGEMQARNSLFDTCAISKSGPWGLKYFSVKWTFENCVFSKTFISPWQVNNVGVQATQCTFLDVDFARVTFREDAGKEALDQWVTLRNCRFIGCKVPESVLLVTKDCVFEDCRFGDPEKDMIIVTPITARIYTPEIRNAPLTGPNRKIEMQNSKLLQQPAGATLRYRKAGRGLAFE